MVPLAPRIQRRLLDEIEQLARQRLPIAELNRRAGAAAARMGLFKPSYEQVRTLVHLARRFRRLGRASASTLATEFVFRLREPRDLAVRLTEPRGPRLRDRAPPSL